jgi:uncharacterized membrane protein
MSNLVAIAYPDMDTAATVADELHQLDKDGSIAIDDLVVVERRADGKVKLHQSHHVSGSGAAGGAGAGMMIGFIFFAPLLGMALGAATGAAVGAHTDRGAEDDFMRTLGERLGERGAAVVVLVRKSTPDKVLPRISQYGGEVIESSLGPEKEAELRDALAAGQGAAV